MGFIGVQSTTIRWEKGWILHIFVWSMPQNRVPFVNQLVWDLFLGQEKSSLYYFPQKKKVNFNSTQSVLNVQDISIQIPKGYSVL